MTGGSLPAQTWHDIMAYAHQGIELKPIPGLGRSPPAARAAASRPRNQQAATPPPAARRC